MTKTLYAAVVASLIATPAVADAARDAGAGAGFAVLAVMFAAYFFPVFIAVLRGHSNALAIGMLNLFLGWSGLGWIGALVWACTNGNRSQHA